MQALLELDCMPAGMELFPAASEEQWTWIKRVIDESDYYVVIIGGRYGSISKKSGLSYTEMEYRYAVEQDKPAIAFLHESPDKILAGKSEKAAAKRTKLTALRTFAEQRGLCKYWNSPSDLGSKVSRSITQLIKRHPSPGWIRANELSESQAKEVLQLRTHIGNLEARLRQLGNEKPEGIDDLKQGDDLHSIRFGYQTKKRNISKAKTVYWTKGSDHDNELSVSWDNIFSALAPELINPCSDYQVVERLNRFIRSEALDTLKKLHKGKKIENIQLFADAYDVIKVQLRALKLILIDGDGAWTLTPYGNTRMNNLLAEHRIE